MILPGATLGVLGGGQLGRMFTVAAREMGYKVIVLDPDPMSPAAALANDHLQREYTDTEALTSLATQCTAVTTEFENVPVAALRVLEAQSLVRPAATAVEYTQNRIREKTFIRDCGLATAPFHPVRDLAELDAALAQVKLPALLKTVKVSGLFPIQHKHILPLRSWAVCPVCWRSASSCTWNYRCYWRAVVGVKSPCIRWRKTFTSTAFWIPRSYRRVPR